MSPNPADCHRTTLHNAFNKLLQGEQKCEQRLVLQLLSCLHSLTTQRCFLMSDVKPTTIQFIVFQKRALVRKTQ